MERNIKYQYFKMGLQTKLNGVWNDAGEFDFIDWIRYVNTWSLEQSTLELKDTKARIEKIKYYKQHDVWVVRFMKLREENLPYLAKENVDAEDIPLQEDEYIAEDMYMLYDINTHIAMIQCNRFSLGLTRLAELFIKSQNKIDERIRLFPIKNEVDLAKLGNTAYRTLELGFANIVSEKPTKKSTLNDILNMYRKFSGITGTIKIGIGRAKDESLDIIEVDKLLEEIGENENVTSARIKIRDDDTARTEIIDLLDDCCSDIITYNLQPRQTLDFETAALNMIDKYKKAKRKIVALTTIPE